MGNFATVTDADLARARQDPAFRRRLISKHLDILLAKLKELRNSCDARVSAQVTQLRDGVELAIKLADLLQAKPENDPPRAA